MKSRKTCLTGSPPSHNRNLNPPRAHPAGWRPSAACVPPPAGISAKDEPSWKECTEAQQSLASGQRWVCLAPARSTVVSSFPTACLEGWLGRVDQQRGPKSLLKFAGVWSIYSCEGPGLSWGWRGVGGGGGESNNSRWLMKYRLPSQIQM